MKFPPFLHSHLRLTLLGTPPNRVFFWSNRIPICETGHLDLKLANPDPESHLYKTPMK